MYNTTIRVAHFIFQFIPKSARFALKTPGFIKSFLLNGQYERDIVEKKSASSLLLLLLLVTRSLSRDGGMAEDHGAPEAGQLLRVWSRGRRETESRQRVSGAKSPWLDSAE